MQEVFEKIKYGLMALAEETYYKSVDGDTNAGQRNSAYHKAIKIIEEVAEKYNDGWITCSERLPENDNYILVSFDNFSMPDIARYEEDKEGGAFYPGDDDKSYVSYGLFVNAWQPLPEPYQPKGDNNEIK